MFLFCLNYLAFLKDACLLTVGLKHSRSNLIFGLHNILFSECSIAKKFRPYGDSHLNFPRPKICMEFGILGSSIGIRPYVLIFSSFG